MQHRHPNPSTVIHQRLPGPSSIGRSPKDHRNISRSHTPTAQQPSPLTRKSQEIYIFLPALILVTSVRLTTKYGGYASPLCYPKPTAGREMGVMSCHISVSSSRFRLMSHTFAGVPESPINIKRQHRLSILLPRHQSTEIPSRKVKEFSVHRLTIRYTCYSSTHLASMYQSAQVIVLAALAAFSSAAPQRRQGSTVIDGYGTFNKYSTQNGINCKNDYFGKQVLSLLE